MPITFTAFAVTLVIIAILDHTPQKNDEWYKKFNEHWQFTALKHEQQAGDSTQITPNSST